MLDFKNFNVSKTARYDEISAVYRIYPYIFNDLDEVYLGDNSGEECPDVHTKDYSKGFEIVTCETQEFYRSHRNYFSAINRDDQFRTIFQNWDYVPVKDLNLRNDFIFRTANRNYVNYDEKEQEIYDRVRENLDKKLTKLNDGYYDRCKFVSLIIFSGYEKKPYVDINKVVGIIAEENKRFSRHFTFIYLIVNDNILQISEFGEVQNINDKRDIKRIYQRSKRNISPEM